MARGKRLLKKPIRVTVLLEEDHFEHVKQKAVDISTKERRIVTPTEVMRDALEKCYPLPGVTCAKDDNLDEESIEKTI